MKMVAREGYGRLFLRACFWVWGTLGLLLNIAQPYGFAPTFPGTSNLWLGGMVLFGLGALHVNMEHDFSRPTEPPQ
jgi:hypothetical protein